MWPLHAVPENRGKAHFNYFEIFIFFTTQITLLDLIAIFHIIMGTIS
jgi:hypothetical protein